MELIFLGADHEVTGSCHMVKTEEMNLLVDCGMEDREPAKHEDRKGKTRKKTIRNIHGKKKS